MSLLGFLILDLTLTRNKVYSKLLNKDEVIYQGTQLRVKSKIYHHGFSANHIGLQKWSGYLYQVCTDQNSFKTSCRQDLQNSRKHFEIAFIGDSFTEAIGMEYEDSFVGLFAKQFSHLNIANLGVSSYSPSIYYAKLKHLLENGYHFDKVFIFIDISDLQDEAIYKLNNDTVIDFEENNWKKQEKYSHVDYIIPDYFYNNLSDNFYLTSIAYSFLVYGKVKPTVYKIPSRLPRGEWTYNPDSPAYGKLGVEGTAEKALQVMRQIHELLESYGIKMSVGVYPWPNQIFNDDLQNNKQSSIWRSFCTNRCEYFFDVFDEFSKTIEKASPLSIYLDNYILGDVHFNRNGNKIVYDTILKTMGD